MTTATQTTGLTSYYPEMGEKKPEGQIEARLSHYGKHWFLYTPLTLKVGRGIEFLGTYTAEQLVPGSKRVGWNQYKVTERAFQQICSQYAVTTESLL